MICKIINFSLFRKFFIQEIGDKRKGYRPFDACDLKSAQNSLEVAT